jgi:hypothetical protein
MALSSVQKEISKLKSTIIVTALPTTIEVEEKSKTENKSI